METKVKVKLVIIGILAALVLTFAVQNAGTVQMEFLFWDFDWSLTILVATLLVVGLVAGWLLRSFRSAQGFDPFGERRRDHMPPPQA